MTTADDTFQKLQAGVTTQTAEATETIGRQLAPHIPENQVLAFHGELGTGKTTFIRGLATAWGIKESVTSPTFNLYTIYKGDRTLLHLDAYRLDSGTDLEALMIEDFLQPPWCLAIEWPERISDTLLEDAWHLHLKIRSDATHHLKIQ